MINGQKIKISSSLVENLLVFEKLLKIQNELIIYNVFIKNS